jgi:hypothetical protein
MTYSSQVSEKDVPKETEYRLETEHNWLSFYSLLLVCGQAMLIMGILSDPAYPLMVFMGVTAGATASFVSVCGMGRLFMRCILHRQS